MVLISFTSSENSEVDTAANSDTRMLEDKVASAAATGVVICFLQGLILQGVISEGHAHFMMYMYSWKPITIDDFDRVTRAELTREYPEGLWRTGDGIEPLTTQQAQNFTSTVSAYSIDRWIACRNGDATVTAEDFMCSYFSPRKGDAAADLMCSVCHEVSLEDKIIPVPKRSPEVSQAVSLADNIIPGPLRAT